MAARRLAFALTLCAASQAFALALPERPEARVNDYAGVLRGGARERLERQIADATAGRSLQIVVAVFSSLEGESLEDVSIRLADKWQVGGKKSDDGVLLTAFVEDHKLRIEVGYGLEGDLPDARASRIIREVIAPRFKEGDYEGGLRDGIRAILGAVGVGPGVATRTRTRQPIAGGVIVFAVIAFVLLYFVLSSFVRRGWSGGAGGWSGHAGSSFLWSLFWNLLLGIGGGGGGGRGSGGGGGGWGGGGGGRFGGGGASGSW